MEPRKRARWGSSGVLLEFPGLKLKAVRGEAAIPNDAPEVTLSGRYGDIWQYSPTHCRAVIVSNRIAKRYLPKERHPVDAGDECLVTFPNEELGLWVKRLRVPKERPAQLRYAETNFRGGKKSGKETA